MRPSASLRRRIKAGFEAAVVHSGIAGRFRGRLRARGLILAYHGIVPAGERPVGERSLHLRESDFQNQLDLLIELTTVVSLDDLLTGAPADEPRPRIAITWDDAYLGALTVGIDAVVRRGLPATVFVAPGCLGGRSFWWDRLAERAGGEMPAAVRERALRELAGSDERIAAALEAGDRGAALPDFVRSADETVLARALGRPGITVASHSWSHPSLAALGPDALAQELGRSRDWLAERFPSRLPFLAYPYGHHSPSVLAAAEDAGYLAGFRIAGGWMDREVGNRYLLPRLNVPSGLSIDGFVLRLSGLLCR